MTHEQLVAAIDAETKRLYDKVRRAATDFFHSQPGAERMLEWLYERVWSERMGTRVHAMAVSEFAEILQAGDVLFLAEQTRDEARHFNLLNACLRRRGGSIFDYQPRAQWRAHFEKEVAVAKCGDPVVLFAVMHMAGEGPAGASAHTAAEMLRGTDYDDVAQAYVEIGQDESRHLALGRAALLRYAATPESLQRGLDAMLSDVESVAIGHSRHLGS